MARWKWATAPATASTRSSWPVPPISPGWAYRDFSAERQVSVRANVEGRKPLAWKPNRMPFFRYIIGKWRFARNRRENRRMQKHLAWLPVAGLFGVLAAANAQTLPATAGGGSYGGNYRLVSSANVNTTYTTRKGQTAPCPSRRAGPLHITNGRVRYTTATGLKVRGTVGPQGELALRAESPSKWGTQPIDLSVSGTVDPGGTARVRQLSHSCSYDFVWQRAAG